ncbi:MAG: hypothetical protein BGO44_08245 [Legionella sp. 39-23]|nr:MAG: hypothetical protein BGO44_08245 [Legionella sp. 39-23]
MEKQRFGLLKKTTFVQDKMEKKLIKASSMLMLNNNEISILYSRPIILHHTYATGKIGNQNFIL